jgi:hypothetical protein
MARILLIAMVAAMTMANTECTIDDVCESLPPDSEAGYIVVGENYTNSWVENSELCVQDIPIGILGSNITVRCRYGDIVIINSETAQ